MHVEKQYDVIVCGGGMAGVTAAIAAAESGAKTLLVEALGELGGSGGAGCVNHWLGGRTYDCREFVIGGLFRRFTESAVAEGIARMPEPVEGHSPHGWQKGGGSLTAGIPFDGVLMAEFLDRQCLTAGVELLFFTRLISCKVESGRIQSVMLHNKSGLFSMSAAQFIDATGDADLAVAAGVPFRIGQEPDGGMAPATLEFQVNGVDAAVLKEYIDTTQSIRFLPEIQELTKRGIWKFPYDRFICVQLNDPDCFMINTSRLVGINGVDGESVSDAMIRGRRETMELFAIMKQYIPGFKNARISRIAPMPGIRETRRIEGDFVLSVSDLKGDTCFHDTIGFCCYGWDLPDPKRPSRQPMTESGCKMRDRIPLPFRIMVPRGVGNLLCPGRAVSVEREVLGPVRVMASCMAMGEAAGVAAATGLRDESLRQRLQERKCIV